MAACRCRGRARRVRFPVYFGRRPTGRPADPSNNMTSRYIDGPVEPQFPFGHGLSYGRFVYSNLRTSAETIERDGEITVEADIVNEGPAAGQETAFLFIRDRVASMARPLLELRGVAKLTLAPGEQGTVRFSLGAAELAFSDEEGATRLESGEFDLYVGPNADPGTHLIVRIKLVS